MKPVKASVLIFFLAPLLPFILGWNQGTNRNNCSNGNNGDIVEATVKDTDGKTLGTKKGTLTGTVSSFTVSIDLPIGSERPVAFSVSVTAEKVYLSGVPARGSLEIDQAQVSAADLVAYSWTQSVSEGATDTSTEEKDGHGLALPIPTSQSFTFHYVPPQNPSGELGNVQLHLFGENKVNINESGSKYNNLFVNIRLKAVPPTCQGAQDIAPAGIAGTTLALGAADFNGDGRKDLVTADGTGVYLFLAKADGTGYEAGQLRLAATDIVALEVADANGDGRPDVLIGRFFDGVSYLAGVATDVSSGRPGLATAPTPLLRISGLNSFKLGQLAGTGSQPDVVAVTANGVDVLKDVGSDPANAATRVLQSAANDLVIAALDDQGAAIVAATANGVQRVTASGETTRLTPDEPVLKVQAATLGDGDKVSLVYATASKLFADLRDGTARIDLGAVSGLKDLQLADLQLDGKLDVVVTDAGGVRTIRGPLTTSSRLASAQVLNRAVNASRTLIADLDADNVPDVITAAPGQLYWAQGSCSTAVARYCDEQNVFGESEALAPQRALASASREPTFKVDVNGDKAADTVTIDANGVKWKDGASGPERTLVGFVPSNLGFTAGTLRVFGADFDGDGDADVVAAASTTPPAGTNPPPGESRIAYFENTDGRGSFAAPKVIKAGELALIGGTDLNGDGYFDIALGTALSPAKAAAYLPHTCEAFPVTAEISGNAPSPSSGSTPPAALVAGGESLTLHAGYSEVRWPEAQYHWEATPASALAPVLSADGEAFTLRAADDLIARTAVDVTLTVTDGRGRTGTTRHRVLLEPTVVACDDPLNSAFGPSRPIGPSDSASSFSVVGVGTAGAPAIAILHSGADGAYQWYRRAADGRFEAQSGSLAVATEPDLARVQYCADLTGKGARVPISDVALLDVNIYRLFAPACTPDASGSNPADDPSAATSPYFFAADLNGDRRLDVVRQDTDGTLSWRPNLCRQRPTGRPISVTPLEDSGAVSLPTLQISRNPPSDPFRPGDNAFITPTALGAATGHLEVIGPSPETPTELALAALAQQTGIFKYVPKGSYPFFKTDANAFGKTSLPFLVYDGYLFSETTPLEIDILPVNDPPTFSIKAPVPLRVRLSDEVPFKVSDFLDPASISVGPENERADQTLNSFQVAVVGAEGQAKFKQQPVFDLATNTLTLTRNKAATGSATVSLTVTDTGPTGTARGDNNRTSKAFNVEFNAAPTVVVKEESLTVNEDKASFNLDLSGSFDPTDAGGGGTLDRYRFGIEVDGQVFGLDQPVNEKPLPSQRTAVPFQLAKFPNVAKYVYVIEVRDSEGAWSVNQDRVTVTVNRLPTADAGEDQIVLTGDTINLKGSGSDPDGTIAGYQWTQIQGPPLVITAGSAESASLSVAAPNEAATLVLGLVVTDNNGAKSARDTVTITVKGNSPPTADAGQDQFVATGATVTLKGTGTDPDGNETIEKYRWDLISGAPNGVALVGGSQDSDTLIIRAPNEPTTLVFGFVVTDNKGANSAQDTVAITVQASANQAPTADAGQNQTLSSDALVTLDGSGSSDPEGGALTYAWTQTAGTTVTLSSTTAQKPTFTAPSGPATLTFSLVVTDDKGASSAAATVTITVNAPTPANSPPTANAGSPQTVNSGVSVTLDGSGSSDPEGGALTYAWTQTAGTTVTLSSTTAQKPTFTAPSGPDTLTFRLVVTDDKGANSAPSTVTITVNAPAGMNTPPTAAPVGCSYDDSVDSGCKLGSNSTDAEDPTFSLTYDWSCTSGDCTNVQILPTDIEAPDFFYTLDVAPGSCEAFTLSLTVTDTGGLQSTGTTSVKVFDTSNSSCP